MKDSQHQQQQQPTQQTLKFIQVSNVKKKPFKRKKYYPNNKSKQSKSATTCNNNSSSGETIDNHQHEQSPHVHSTTTCSSSSNNNNRTIPSSSSTTIHEMGLSSSDHANLNDINPISSFHSLDGLPQQHHLHMSQQHPSNIRGSQHVSSSSAEEVSKLSDSSSIEYTYMHRGGASSPPINNNMLSQNINNNTSGNNASSSPGTCNNAASNSLQFVMEASPKYITHVAKKRNTLSKDNLIRVLHLSQVQACKVLGCSLSTLKRRFGEVKQELGMEKWPSYYDDVRHLPIFPKLYPMSLQFILNERDCNDLPTNCDLIFENAAHLSTTFPKPPYYQPTSDE